MWDKALPQKIHSENTFWGFTDERQKLSCLFLMKGAPSISTGTNTHSPIGSKAVNSYKKKSVTKMVCAFKPFSCKYLMQHS